MPFVKRDTEGKIIAVYESAADGATEEVGAGDPGLGEFLTRAGSAQGGVGEWLESDLALARVLEDLIDILIEKNILVFTDFPSAAQHKLLQRRGLRSQFSYVDSLFADDDMEFGGAGPGGEDDSLL